MPPSPENFLPTDLSTALLVGRASRDLTLAGLVLVALRNVEVIDIIHAGATCLIARISS